MNRKMQVRLAVLERRLAQECLANPMPLSKAKRREYERLFALIENARAELRGERPPNVLQDIPPEEKETYIREGWATHDWLRDSWTRTGGGQHTEEEQEFLSGMREELEKLAREDFHHV